MNPRFQGLALIALCAIGCASPAYVIENSEHPLFLGDGDLLTARIGSQEVNVRHIREGGARLKQSWLDPLAPAERSFEFDPTWGRILSVGQHVEGENPLRSGPPQHRRDVKAGLLLPDTVFSLRSWPGGSELVTRKTSPGLARTADGALVLRRSREAQFELYDTASGEVVAKGPLRDPEARMADDRGADLSAACFTGPGRFVFAWQGTVYQGALSGNRCTIERIGAGSALASRDGRLYVLVKHRWLRAFDLETKRPLWQLELPELEVGDGDPWSWKLTLSPNGEAIAVQARDTFVVVGTKNGQRLLGPLDGPRDAPQMSLSLGDRRCAALYSGWDTSFGWHVALAWDYGPKQLNTLAFEHRAQMGARGIALSADGQWLALSGGSQVQVWRVD